MRRSFFLVTIAILLAGLVLLGLNDTDIAVADTDVYAIEPYIRQHEASNSSTSATILITMYTVANE